VAENFSLKGGARLGRTTEAFISASEDLTSARASVNSLLGREGDVSVPIGILYGAEDNLLDPSLHGEKFAELSGADLKLLKGRGHMIPLTAPKLCADYIQDMAKRI